MDTPEDQGELPRRPRERDASGRETEEEMIPEYLNIPVFPLPNVTFFPRTLLPLHVFEPRYRKMISACLAGDRMLGVALLREGWQKDYFGRPPIHRTFGVGKIIDHEELNDGCFNIMVEGLWRVRLINEFEGTDFRAGHVAVLQDGPIDQIHDDIALVHRDLIDDCDKLSELLPEYQETLRNVWGVHPHPCVAGDMLAASIVIDSYDRQSILEEPDPLRRMQLVAIQIKNILYQLSGDMAEAEQEILEED